MLSSIGGSGGQLLSPTTETAPVTPQKPSVDRSSSNRVQNKSQGGANGVVKHKADDRLSAPRDKTVRPDLTSGRPIQTLSTLAKDQVLSTTPTKPALASSATATATPMPYRGTGKPAAASPIPAKAESKAPPKKGSYAEIMARAKASQTASAHVGIIKHKPKEKLSKKEQIALAKGLSLKMKPNAKDGARPSSADPKNHSPNTPDGPNKVRENGGAWKKTAQLSYTGTAKPKSALSYKGTMKPLTSTTTAARKKASRDTDSDRSPNRSRSTSVGHAAPKYRYRDETSGEDEDEEEEPYESDLSDMEAGFSDVEEEDERALKAAKKEDEFELMMEKELKRQKERKKREAALAAVKSQRA